MVINIPIDIEKEDVPECQGIEQAVKRFEKVLLSRIYVQQRLGDRLTISIRVGMTILFFLAVSLFILLLTLSMQVRETREVVMNMNNNFSVISNNMKVINLFMTEMEKQVAYLPLMKKVTSNINQHMGLMDSDFSSIQHEIKKISLSVQQIDGKLLKISGEVQNMNNQVGLLALDTYQLSKPAKQFNDFFPF